MGIGIGITVSHAVPEDKWNKVYDEALDLAREMGLIEHTDQVVRGHTVLCITPIKESTYGNRTGWETCGEDYFRKCCEYYFFPKDLGAYGANETEDVIVHRAKVTDILDEEACYDNFREFWGAKTQGYPYHMELLAIGCLVQDRLEPYALVHTDINAGQCRQATKLANEYLDTPIRVPCQVDADRFLARIQTMDIDGRDRIKIAMDMYLGRKDASYGGKLREVFTGEELGRYWAECMAGYDVTSIGFKRRLKEYLSMGFDIGKLCGYPSFTDGEGNDRHEQFIRILLDSKLHWKEKDCSDWMEQDPDDPTLYGIEALLIRTFAMGARNPKVDRYIPMDEIRAVLNEHLGGDCDVNSILDQYLKEEQTEDSKSDRVNKIMDEAKADLDIRMEKYDILETSRLHLYKPGKHIEPNIEKLLRKILDFAADVCEKYRDDIARLDSDEMKEEWLSRRAGYHLLLTREEWETVFDHVEEGQFERYFGLFSIDGSSTDVGWAVMALVMNDALYGYACTLPASEEDGPRDGQE